MRTILKKNLSWCFLILLCFAVLCCKKETNSTQIVKNDSDTLAIELKVSEINKANMNLTQSNINFFVSQIQDSLATEYVKEYFKIFPDENKFRRVFTMGINAYNNILKEATVSGNQKVKLFFTENNGMLDVVYENSNGKKVSINDNDIINDSIYLTMNNAFKGNCYNEMNIAINGLDINLKENTREIIIPINELKRLNPSNKSIIVFLPGVTTINTNLAGGLKNQKNYLTLVAFTIEVINSSTGEIKLEKNVIYDNFCVSPPNNC